MFFEKLADGEKYAVAYDSAVRDDGTLLFPSRLSKEFLLRQRKIQGSYIFSHQYLNQIIPADDQDFKKEWLVYYTKLPEIKNTFAMIDPAISLDTAACYTAFCIVDIDVDNNWYLKAARRVRITATQTIDLIFKIHEMYKCTRIGVEAVAYQMALMHFLDSEMRKRKTVIPIVPISRGPDKSKGMRIRSLVPRFEWQRLMIKPGLTDFEDEYMKFPRGTYVDILDALSSIEEFAFPPEPPKPSEKAPHPSHKDYEGWFLRQQLKKEQDNEQAQGFKEQGDY